MSRLFFGIWLKLFSLCVIGNSNVELAVTGSGLPVSLVPSPSETFDFPTCAIGGRVDRLCVLKNLCPQLPINFRFSKLAHFTVKPSIGTISPGQCQVMLVFDLVTCLYIQAEQ